MQFINKKETENNSFKCNCPLSKKIFSSSPDAPNNVAVSLPKDEEFLEGSDVMLTCSSRLNPPPHTYEWYHGNSKPKLETQDQKIKVQNVSKDTEPYSCVAINIVGRGESPPKPIPVRCMYILLICNRDKAWDHNILFYNTFYVFCRCCYWSSGCCASTNRGSHWAKVQFYK